MKFYRYPIALIAYSLFFVFIVVYAWHYIGDKTPATYWYFFPAIGAAYLLIAFVLSKITMPWELDVALQVAFVLAPVLWYVNQREPYKRPVYVFLINSEHSGKLEVFFNQEKNAETKVRSTADTLYFKFDENGEILLNEDADYVRQSMRQNLFVYHPDGSRKRASYYELSKLPADTTVKVLVEDSAEADKGRMKALHFRLDYPQKLAR